MAAVLKSVSKSQALKLAVKVLLLSLVVFWLRLNGGFWPGAFFLILFTLFFFKPLAGSLKFLPSAIVAVYLPFILPKSEFYLLEIVTAVIFGFLYYLILGIKNLIFIRRRQFYQLSHLLSFILLAFSYFYLPSVAIQVAFFLLITLLLKEFYSFLGEMTDRIINIISLVSALVIVEIFWAVALLPLSITAAAVFLTLILFVLQDIILNYKAGFLTRKIIIRDTAAFSILSIILFSLSSWSLS